MPFTIKVGNLGKRKYIRALLPIYILMLNSSDDSIQIDLRRKHNT